MTTVPSTTGVAWATIFTGVAPAVHGFAGNEFFVREKNEFAAPIPVSVSAFADAISVFTDGYANKFLGVPTIYEAMRKRDPHVSIWVSMSQFYRGADQLLMTRTSVLAAAMQAFLEGHTEKNLPRDVWADLDKEDIEVVLERLGKEPRFPSRSVTSPRAGRCGPGASCPTPARAKRRPRPWRRRPRATSLFPCIRRRPSK